MATAHFSTLQGQYLAFIDAYTKIHRIPPAEADMQRYWPSMPRARERFSAVFARRRRPSTTWC
jgi:hypothetical protein